MNNKIELKYRAYNFSITIVKFVSQFPNNRIYWIISDQLLRAATSIGANIIEAQAASSKRDFIKFFEIALKSSNETKYWLGILRDGTEMDKNKVFEYLNNHAKFFENNTKYGGIEREIEKLTNDIKPKTKATSSSLEDENAQNY